MMTHRSKSSLLLPLLALCLTLAVPAHAGTSASLQINFGTTPHWTSIQGTRVSEIRDSERPDYDIFRYGGMYYVYNDEHWYQCRTQRGNYIMIQERYVPREFSRVPRGHWKRYPAAWGDRYDHVNNGRGHDNGRGNGNGNNGRGNGKGH
jgi:hypothetical protein